MLTPSPLTLVAVTPLTLYTLKVVSAVTSNNIESAKSPDAIVPDTAWGNGTFAAVVSAVPWATPEAPIAIEDEAAARPFS